MIIIIILLFNNFLLLFRSWNVALISLVYAIGPTSVLFGKHTDKLEEDKVTGVHTLPVLIGEKAARYTNITLWILQLILTVGIVITGTMSISMLLVLFAIPKLVSTAKVYLKPRPKQAPTDLPPNVWPLYLSANAFVYNKRFGYLFLLGLIIDVILVRNGITLF